MVLGGRVAFFFGLPAIWFWKLGFCNSSRIQFLWNFPVPTISAHVLFSNSLLSSLLSYNVRLMQPTATNIHFYIPFSSLLYHSLYFYRMFFYRIACISCDPPRTAVSSPRLFYCNASATYFRCLL